MKNKVPLMKVICLILLWCLAVYGMTVQFFERSVPLYREELINDASGKITKELMPQDAMWQFFHVNADDLESVSIAFDYEDAARDVGQLLVRVYHRENLVMEQPLPLAACPPRTFLEFHLGLREYKGEELGIQIVNTSEDSAGVFSLMETQNTYVYQDYSEGYLLNDAKDMAGSILCSFKIRTGRHYYLGLTYAFWIFLISVMLSCVIVRGVPWLPQHKSH